MTLRPFVIFGAQGQVGRMLSRHATAQGLEVKAFTRGEVDITDPADVRDAVAGASFVVNCAAYTAVDKAESEPDAAFAVNARAPGLMAEACRDADVPLLHISTDYVFGEPKGRAWREDDASGPLNVYGRSKLEGEVAVRDAWHKHLILRTAWVYDSEGKNFVLTMLRLGAERPELKIVGDQHGGPTSADDIAVAILRMAGAAGQPGFDGWGTYHFAGGPPTTWFDFASAIFDRGAGGPDAAPRLVRIATADFPTPARRPPFSVLDCGKILQRFGIDQPDWRKSLDKVLEVIGKRS